MSHQWFESLADLCHHCPAAHHVLATGNQTMGPTQMLWSRQSWKEMWCDLFLQLARILASSLRGRSLWTLFSRSSPELSPGAHSIWLFLLFPADGSAEKGHRAQPHWLWQFSLPESGRLPPGMGQELRWVLSAEHNLAGIRWGLCVPLSSTNRRDFACQI